MFNVMTSVQNLLVSAGWPSGYLVRSPRSQDVAGSSPRSRAKGVNTGIGCFLAILSALSGYNQDWLARVHDNVTGWCIRVLCLRHGVGSTYKSSAIAAPATSSYRCDKTERLLKK